MGIEYVHLKALAPTNEIRALQWQADKEDGTRKRDRTELSKDYKHEYTRQILKAWKKPEDKLNVMRILANAREGVRLS